MKTMTNENQALRTVQAITRYTYAFVPIVAGLDKFTNLLTDWEKYLNPAVADLLPFTPHTFMLLVGVIEIIAGILVLLRPQIGAYIVMGWLIAIALSLIASGQYFDIAVRDLSMAVGAYTLARLSEVVPSTAKEKPGLQEGAGAQALAR